MGHSKEASLEVLGHLNPDGTLVLGWGHKTGTHNEKAEHSESWERTCELYSSISCRNPAIRL